MKLERIVKRFYDELDEGRIMGRKCPVCGAVEFPPKIACTACGNFETEWVEMSGKGMMTEFIMTSGMAHPRVEQLQPCAFACVTVEEGAEINAVVRGITPENAEELRARLPLPVKACIVQREGYKSVVYDLVPG